MRPAASACSAASVNQAGSAREARRDARENSLSIAATGACDLSAASVEITRVTHDRPEAPSVTRKRASRSKTPSTTSLTVQTHSLPVTTKARAGEACNVAAREREYGVRKGTRVALSSEAVAALHADGIVEGWAAHGHRHTVLEYSHAATCHNRPPRRRLWERCQSRSWGYARRTSCRYINDDL